MIDGLIGNFQFEARLLYPSLNFSLPTRLREARRDSERFIFRVPQHML